MIDGPTPKLGVDELLVECFRHFVNLDEANAAVHCAPTRYSPITFRLAEQIADRSMPFLVEGGMLWTQLYAVIDDAGRYPEDPGRSGDMPDESALEDALLEAAAAALVAVGPFVDARSIDPRLVVVTCGCGALFGVPPPPANGSYRVPALLRQHRAECSLGNAMNVGAPPDVGERPDPVMPESGQPWNEGD